MSLLQEQSVMQQALFLYLQALSLQAVKKWDAPQPMNSRRLTCAMCANAHLQP